MTGMCWETGMCCRALRHAGRTTLWIALLGAGQTAWAQTVPTDLLDLSIEALFEANVVTEAERAQVARRWHASYTYAVSDYHDYYLGTQRINYDEVLFQPGQEDRTGSNYPVVPTEIKQEVHALRLAYDLTPAVNGPCTATFCDAKHGPHLNCAGLRCLQYQFRRDRRYRTLGGRYRQADPEQYLEAGSRYQRANWIH